MGPDLSQFVVQISRKRKMLNLLAQFVCPVLVVALTLYFPWYGDTLNTGFILVFGLTSLVITLLYDSRWNLTVSGDDIQFETLWTKRDLTFEKITSVKLTRNRKQLKMYDGSGIAMRIFGDCVGYQELIARLRETGAPGTETL